MLKEQSFTEKKKGGKRGGTEGSKKGQVEGKPYSTQEGGYNRRKKASGNTSKIKYEKKHNKSRGQERYPHRIEEDRLNHLAEGCPSHLEDKQGLSSVLGGALNRYSIM